ncbi:hypothetical protein V8C44DRAFT_42698 [Trichoderma aethiopicum]
MTDTSLMVIMLFLWHDGSGPTVQWPGPEDAPLDGPPREVQPRRYVVPVGRCDLFLHFLSLEPFVVGLSRYTRMRGTNRTCKPCRNGCAQPRPRGSCVILQLQSAKWFVFQNLQQNGPGYNLD